MTRTPTNRLRTLAIASATLVLGFGSGFLWGQHSVPSSREASVGPDGARAAPTPPAASAPLPTAPALRNAAGPEGNGANAGPAGGLDGVALEAELAKLPTDQRLAARALLDHSMAGKGASFAPGPAGQQKLLMFPPMNLGAEREVDLQELLDRGAIDPVESDEAMAIFDRLETDIMGAQEGFSMDTHGLPWDHGYTLELQADLLGLLVEAADELRGSVSPEAYAATEGTSLDPASYELAVKPLVAEFSAR